MFWIKFPLNDIKYHLKMYCDYPMCVYNGYGYVFRDIPEWSRFLDRHPEAEIIY